MYVQLKTGYDIDRGPSWIARVRFSKTWATAYVHGRTLRRWPGLFDANFFDVETLEEFWLSGPKRDGLTAALGRAVHSWTRTSAKSTRRFCRGRR